MADYKQQRWVTTETIINENRAFVRKNVSLSETDRAQFPHVVIVNLIFQKVSDDGMPTSDEELSRLDDTEENVADQIGKDFGGLYGMAVTHDGTRDLFFFLPKLPKERQIEESINTTEPSVDYDFSTHFDADWLPYEELDAE